jgi:ABC-type molybdate transport system substrate-binding protein
MFAVMISTVMIMPAHAQLYYDDNTPSSIPSYAQQNQLKITDKGSLAIGLYTEPANPSTSNPVTLELSFEDKDTRTLIQNVDYAVSITNDTSTIYQSPISHSSAGTAKILYQFKVPGKYDAVISVTAINSKQMPKESASFSINVDSSAVPEFPLAVPIFLIGTISVIAFYSMRFGKMGRTIA